MSRIFTPFVIVITLLSLSVVAKAANIDVLAANQTINMLTDFTTFAPPKEQTKNVPGHSSSKVLSAQEDIVNPVNGKIVITESGNYKFRETSTLKSMTFSLICIGFVGLIAARRFKRAFI